MIFHVFSHKVLVNVDMLGSLVKGGLFARAIEYWLSESRDSSRPALSLVQLCHKPQHMKIYFRIYYLLLSQLRFMYLSYLKLVSYPLLSRLSFM